jgi:hypothetical protein
VRILALGVVGLSLLVAAGIRLVAFPALAARDRSHVQVEAPADAVRCTGSNARDSSMIIGDRRTQRSTVPVRDAMRCTVAVTVRNDGHRSVSLDAVSLAMLGRGSGWPIDATTALVGGRRIAADAGPSMATDDLDARFPMGLKLDPGDVQRIEVVLRHKAGGCMSPHSVLTIRPPAVVIRSWNETGTIDAPVTMRFVADTDLDSCDVPG